MDYKAVDKVIVDGGGRKLAAFDHPVGQLLQIENVIVVRLDISPAGRPLNENIYGVSTGGQKIWQVQKRRKYRTAADSPYVDMKRAASAGPYSNNVYAWGWDGVRVELDPFTGRIFNEKEVN